MRRLLRSGLLRDNIALLALSMVVNVLGFGFQYVMARLLEPAAYAEMFAVLSLLTLFAVPAVALNTLVIKMTGELFVQGLNEKLRSWVVAWGARIGAAGLIVGIGFAASSGWISRALQLDSGLSVIVAGLAIFLAFTTIAIRGALAGMRSFVVLGIAGVAETTTRLVSALVLVLLGFAAAGAVAGSAAGAFAVIVIGGMAVRRITTKPGETAAGRTEELPVWADQARVLALTLALTVIFNTDVLFVKHYFAEFEAASYSAVALVGRTIFFASAPVATVLLPHTIKSFRQGVSVVPGVLTSVGMIVAIAALVAAVVLLFPGQLFRVAFSDRYLPDKILLLNYAAAGSLMAVNVALAQLHIGVGHLRPWRALALFAVGMVVAMSIAHSSMTQLAGALAATSAVTFAYLALETFLLIRRAASQPTGASA